MRHTPKAFTVGPRTAAQFEAGVDIFPRFFGPVILKSVFATPGSTGDLYLYVQDGANQLLYCFSTPKPGIFGQGFSDVASPVTFDVGGATLLPTNLGVAPLPRDLVIDETWKVTLEGSATDQTSITIVVCPVEEE